MSCALSGAFVHPGQGLPASNGHGGYAFSRRPLVCSGCTPPLAAACFLLAVLFLCIFGPVGGWCAPSRDVPARTGTVSLDFVDATLSDVARSLSLAYDTPIVVDEGAEVPVTLHLDSVGLLEGLSAICGAHGLEVVKDGRVLHIRRVRERGESEFAVSDSGVSLAVKGKDVAEFASEYAANTGLNILVEPDVQGKVSGRLRNMPAVAAFRALMESQGFTVRSEGGCLRVSVRRDRAGPEGASVFRDDSLYSVDLAAVPLASVLREIAAAAGLNLAMYGDMQEPVRLKFDRVPLRDLVGAVFRGSRYAYVLDSANLFVAETGVRNALSQTRLYPLKYIDSEKALAHLSKFMPGNSFVAAEVKEQNALLLGGVPEEIAMAESLLVQVDLPALQVTLSCIIVEIKRGKNFEIGLRGGNARKTAAGDIGFRGFFDFLGKDLSKSGAFGKVGFLPDRFEMELASLEENNMAEVLARPKLTTLNGSKAELNVTNTVYYLVSQVSADGYPITDYRSFNDGISLELTPVVTREGSITLEVSPEIKTAGRSSGDGPRDISTRNLKTSVVLRNGETLCLGGLMRKNKSEVRTAVPFLGSLPLVGRLFSYTSTQDELSELAIFITPEVEPSPAGGSDVP